MYVGDDPDKIAVAYEHLVYENRYDKCQFVKDINEFKVDRWTKVYFIQDIFRHVIHSSDIDKMRGALDEIYLAAGQQPLSMFILEMPLALWTEHRKYLQEMALFHDQHISFVWESTTLCYKKDAVFVWDFFSNANQEIKFCKFLS